MVKSLRDLMVDATTAAPDDHFLAADLIPAGRSAVRRRHVAVGIATCAAVAAGITGVMALDVGQEDRTVPPPPVDKVVRVEQAGPVLQLADAVPAREGRDYEVLGTNEVPDLDQKDGLSFRAVVAGGQILVADGQPFQDVRRWGFVSEWSPVRWMPTVPGDQPRRFLGDPDGTLFEEVWDQETLHLWRLKQYNNSWEPIDIDLRPLGHVAVMEGPGFVYGFDRIWGAVSADDGRPSKLYSHPLSPEGDWSFVADVTSFAVSGWGLLYVDPEGRVHARPLGGAQDDVLDLPADDACTVAQVAAGGRLAAVSLSCEDLTGFDGKTLVLGLDRSLLATVVGTGGARIDVGDDFLMVTQEAVHVLDVPSARLLRLTDNGTPGSTLDRDVRWGELVGDGRQEIVAQFL